MSVDPVMISRWVGGIDSGSGMSKGVRNLVDRVVVGRSVGWTVGPSVGRPKMSIICRLVGHSM